MSARLIRLRDMRAWVDAEIAAELRLIGAPLGADSFIQRAAELYGVAAVDLLGDTRGDHQAARARQAAAWLLRRAGMSLHEVGAVLGCHHTTVLYSCRKIEGLPHDQGAAARARGGRVRQSDPCYMGQHDRCKSPFCRCALCGCKDKTNPEDAA
jgi:hypothetical protein